MLLPRSRNRLACLIAAVLAALTIGGWWAARQLRSAGRQSAQEPPIERAAPPVEPPAPAFPMFRGNPERNLSATGPVPRRPQLLWRFRTKVRPEGIYEQRGSHSVTPTTLWQGLGWTGQPVLLGDRVYFGSTDSYVYCLDANTGQPAWRYPTHHSVKGSIAVFDQRIYHGGRDNKLHCYDLAGRMLWELRTGNDMDSSPVVVGGVGFIGGEDDAIYAFHPDTGDILWRFPTSGSVESSPCVAGGRVFAGTGAGLLYCCDAGTGDLIWSFDTRGDTDSTPVHHEGRIYVGSATSDFGERGHLWCVDAETGQPIWHVPMRRGIWATVALNADKGRLYVGSNDGALYAFAMEDGSPVWRRKLGNRIWGSAAVADGCVLVPTRDGLFWCLDEETGEPIWALDTGADMTATPLVAEGLIVTGSQDGWIYAIGQAPEGAEVNHHWFATDFPMRRRLDRNPEGVPTPENPAPDPEIYQDTSARCDTDIFKPVYGGRAPQRPR